MCNKCGVILLYGALNCVLKVQKCVIKTDDFINFYRKVTIDKIKDYNLMYLANNND